MASCAYCPTDCSQELLLGDFLQQCTNPLEGGIDILVIAPLDDSNDKVPLTFTEVLTPTYSVTTNVNTLTTWTNNMYLDGNIAHQDNENYTWNIVTVYGSYTSAQSEVIRKGKHCTYNKAGTHTLSARVCNARSTNNTSPASYNFLRKLQCGQKVRIWFGNAGVLFGGESNFADGIEATVNNAGVETGETADDAITEFIISLTWKGCLPSMIQSNVFSDLIPEQ